MYLRATNENVYFKFGYSPSNTISYGCALCKSRRAINDDVTERIDYCIFAAFRGARTRSKSVIVALICRLYNQKSVRLSQRSFNTLDRKLCSFNSKWKFPMTAKNQQSRSIFVKIFTSNQS